MVIVFVPLLSPVFQLVHSGFLKYTSSVHFITVKRKHHLTTILPQLQQKYMRALHTSVRSFHLEYTTEMCEYLQEPKKKD